MEHGEQVAERFRKLFGKKRAPRIMRVEVKSDLAGLMPNPDKYSDWRTGFVKMADPTFQERNFPTFLRYYKKLRQVREH